MSPELTRHLISPLLKRHPLPWSIELDWTVEVYDANHGLVTKLMHVDHARELIAAAEDAAEYERRGEEEYRKMLADHGLEPFDNER